MNINYLPRGERLLSGTISALLTDSATTIEVSNPPSASELPTYIEFEPDSSANRELCRVIKVSSNIITLERGLNNGGTGIEHASNSSYKQKMTSRHLDAIADAIQEGYLMEDSIRTLTRASATQFTVDGYGAGDDLTAYYTVGRAIRCNSSDSDIVVVSSSSYSAGTNKTTVNITGTLPASLTTVELAIGPRGYFDPVLNKSTGTVTDLIADTVTAETTNGNLKLKGNGTGIATTDGDCIEIVAIDYTTDLATGDGKAYVTIPTKLNGMNLDKVHARVITAGTTNTTDIQIHNVTDAVDMLSTVITIDSGETGSDTAATAAVIDTDNDDVATNDLLRIDIDAVSTTAPKGLIIRLEFRNA